MVAMKPKRSGLGLELQSFTGKDGKTSVVAPWVKGYKKNVHYYYPYW